MAQISCICSPTTASHLRFSKVMMKKYQGRERTKITRLNFVLIIHKSYQRYKVQESNCQPLSCWKWDCSFSVRFLAKRPGNCCKTLAIICMKPERNFQINLRLKHYRSAYQNAGARSGEHGKHVRNVHKINVFNLATFAHALHVKIFPVSWNRLCVFKVCLIILLLISSV